MEGVKINVASWEDSFELHRAVMDVWRRENVGINDLIDETVNLDKIISAAIAVSTDKSVYNAVWACLARCTYKGEKITKVTFEDAETRSLYVPIVAECIEANIMPFIEGLRSVLVMFRSPAASSIQE
jgi:hypothetical protein